MTYADVRPPVTVVTATWGRPKTIAERAIPSVAAQDYQGSVEHLIITDGVSTELNTVLAGYGYYCTSFPEPGKRIVPLGRNWSAPEMARGGVGVIPRRVGAYLASGDYIAYLDDDNEYLPHHITVMVDALEKSGADFALSRWQDGPAVAPRRGVSDTNCIMHRPSVLRYGTWDPADGYENDGALVERWAAAGASHVIVPEPTFILHPHRIGAPDD
jgi:glycosyltransferase involved in cell wall biosynthesis